MNLFTDDDYSKFSIKKTKQNERKTKTGNLISQAHVNIRCITINALLVPILDAVVVPVSDISLYQF